MNTNKYVHTLSTILTPYFNIYRDEKLGTFSLPFYAHYHRRDEKYFMTKKSKIWAVENEQFIFVWQKNDIVTKRDVIQFSETFINHVPNYISNHQDHMSTVFIGAIVAPHACDEAIREVKHFRKLKFIRFGLHGWLECYIAIISLDTKQLFTHRKARSFTHVFEKPFEEDVR
ncbi:hypothetical protein JEG43_10850 [Anoxybacillus sp. LAT_35]|nr:MULTISPECIES: hypothetical protein [Anoxybacillus]MCG5026440.1 hypothetical protein [Anoxybacillus flavithermus]MCG6196838.1 hypothetical protein [Anoxybacillus sp. LAT_38]MCG3084438.1 hypothetical protein [Anoxybacillus sp. LAT27]MCG6172642.1 hypothetical protein [Anoxybacillus sp. LAT_11]MCG6176169.1 hypothetical protein [Anoxybacillus sp. LAT_31]